jgi:uncharacterized protein YkwD
MKPNKKTLLRLALLFLLSLNIVFLNVKYAKELSGLRQSLVERFGIVMPKALRERLVPAKATITYASATQFQEALNALRSKWGLQPFASDEKTCELATAIAASQQKDAKSVVTQCKDCHKNMVLRLSNTASTQALVLELQSDEQLMSALKSSDYTHVCVQSTGRELVTLLVSYFDPSEMKPRIVEKIITTTPAPVPTAKNFSESEIWSALGEYRRAHQRTTLELDDNLCIYARKRVDEHISMMSSKQEVDYPNPDKYPLDAHEGFKRDGDSGILFEITKRNLIAENLAYWPSAQYPHHVIEWGWDTSTEGHREAQLSNDFSHGCISGRDGFYVAIFGK